ncbi:MAG: hypothetical protein LV481_01925 [Methylacidiphilales bacterium]|nr:hypothetical protein [Candidatus Methylacidiphilales bacterium]
MADLGDFLSAAGVEDFATEAMYAETKPSRTRARRHSTAKATQPGEAFAPPISRRNGQHAGFSRVRPSPKRKVSRRKPVVVTKAEAPLATGTFGG